MTVQEAIKICFGKPYVVDVEEHEEAIKTIKGAIAELEQYRAIGSTPTQILERIGGLSVELGKYYSLGTVEELKEAMEKQMAKKVKPLFKGDFIGFYECECGAIVEKSMSYCCECGKKLDWSKEDD